MIRTYVCAALSVALEKLKEIAALNEKAGVRTVVFCEDRLSLAAERMVCAAAGGTFLTSVYTFSRFLSAECGKVEGVLSAQGSAMAVRRIIEENRSRLTLFKQLSAPAAAQTVYDTIALLYSSRVSAEDIAAVSGSGGLLGGKLKDISLIYSEYIKYLAANGLEDRNGYLRRLGPVVETSSKIKGAEVVFLGFQAFTQATKESARAAFISAKDVTGLFIGGREDIYVNEAAAAFNSAAVEFGGAAEEYCAGNLLPEADRLRRGLFDPDSLRSAPMPTDRISLFEARDGAEELEYIAATIKKHVQSGERYAKISVMLPDLAGCERELKRVFSEYRIPYYADRRIALSEHPLCAFIFGLLNCKIYGCRPSDVDGVISSPYFPAEKKDKDIFRNYCLKFANFRGGVRREPKQNADVNKDIRKTFLKAMDILDERGIFGGVRGILDEFGAEDKLRALSEKFAGEYPVNSAFGSRALEKVYSVLEEAETLAEGLSDRDIVKILKSGFAAAEISLIPPKADAVFVGDTASTANTGSNVVFAARLTGDVPSVSLDTSLLTDRDLIALGQVNLDISPKIRQVNMRKRETFALNACAFREYLYLSYPVRLNGEESGQSEIITYVKRLFCTKGGERLRPVTYREAEREPGNLPYFASEKLPAIKLYSRLKDRSAAAAVFETLKNGGYGEEAAAALKTRRRPSISCGRQLFFRGDCIAPTTLETYFGCPYLAFMERGLGLDAREEQAVSNIDLGTLIHAVFKELAEENLLNDAVTAAGAAERLTEKYLSIQPYSALYDRAGGKYTAGELKKEMSALAVRASQQLVNSSFDRVLPEYEFKMELTGGIKLYGKIDRIDYSRDLVRVIDYKSGSVDCKFPAYYMGRKLQLELYLLYASAGKRAAGAYYFPASVTYTDEANLSDVLRLQGFMDGSQEIVLASDTAVTKGKKARYVNANLNGRAIDSAMDRETFENFLSYAKLVAAQGALEMAEGNVAPSPAGGVCDYCKMGGSCNFAVGRDGGERTEIKTDPAVTGTVIAAIAAGKEEKNG